MNDKELADKVRVVLKLAPWGYTLDPAELVRDWRVAGALEQLVIDRDWIINVDHHGCTFVFTDKDEPHDVYEAGGDNLCRNRIEACAEALT
jgi:hypothetical protein